ncbi:hypothetical protein [Streptomyces cuspidosporus]|uniref:hypothetical protein n=1 Tax=Streptomyces cuspidosporus TaxID=66882 RepID=UPI0031FC7F9F
MLSPYAAPARFHGLIAGPLAAAITACVAEPAHRRRAAAFARRLAAEDGAAAVPACLGVASGSAQRPPRLSARDG